MPEVPTVKVDELPNNIGEQLFLVAGVDEVESGDGPMVVVSLSGRNIPMLGGVADNRPFSIVLTPPAATLLADLLRKGVKEYLRPPAEEEA